MAHDYKKLGFKCGLEIHQQLETHNLFCNCPSIVHDKNPAPLAKRKLKAVVGETGEIDAAAAHEQTKAKEMVYEGCEQSYCLVELDEEPPTDVNEQAVDIAIMVAKMLHAEVVDEIQIMRKTVIDGSNVGGFQRTALVAMDGYIETSKGKVGVPTICLEEEAAKKDSTTKETITYRLDRLGVCLLEIATDATIQDPEHAKECAEILGMILRSTGMVKRGIGTIRQDVNVSIKGGERVEIKGFQDLKSIPKVAAGEVDRQLKAIKKGEKLAKEVRKAESDFTTSFMRPMPGAARLYPETDALPVVISKKRYDAIKVPELLSDKKESLAQKYKLDQGFIDEIVSYDLDFDALVKQFSKLEPVFIATVLVQIPKELRRKEKLDTNKLAFGDFEEVLGLVHDGKVPKQAVTDILVKKIKGEAIDLSAYAAADDSEVETYVAQVIKDKPGLNMGGYMGLVMKQFGGKVDGKKASQIIAKLIK